MAQDMELQIKITTALDGAVNSFKSLQTEVTKFGLTAAAALKTFGNSVDDLEKRFKKFGRELTQNVTAPLGILAGLSLKKVFDQAVIGSFTASTYEFAASVQFLKKDFDGLLITIGKIIAPFLVPFVNLIRDAIATFQSFGRELQTVIIATGSFLALLGPLSLAIAGVLSVVSQLSLAFAGLSTFVASVTGVFGTILGVIFSVKTAIAAAVVALVGLGNVFINLKDSGLSFGQAFLSVFKLIVLQAAEMAADVLKIFLVIPNKILEAFGLISINKLIGDSLNKEKEAINANLKKIGSSLGDSLTLGLKGKWDSFWAEAKPATLTIDTTEVDKKLDEQVKKSQELLKEFRRDQEEQQKQMISNVDNVAKPFAAGITDSFEAIANGSKSVGQAFEDFARDFITNISKMILNALIYKSIMQALGFGAGGTGNAAGSATSDFFGGIGGFANGGFVSGPGTGTSDSIPAKLSNGEFVLRAAAVKKLGVGFLNGLNEIDRSGFNFSKSHNSFADGGLVTSAAASPQVVIENKGTPKQTVSQTTDPSTGIITVIIDDMQKNGPISKALAGTFNMKRGAFS